jgi:CBS-domain-containing membrane protein
LSEPKDKSDRERGEPRITSRYRIDRLHPIGGEMSDIVIGLLRRLQLTELTKYHNSTVVLAVFSLINGFISIALMSIVALLTKSPFVFPSLGPTAFLFFYTPRAPASSPRNTICGHLIGALAGWASLAIFGLTTAPPALVTGVIWPRVAAAALSLSITGGLMVLCKVPHPPAGATTLIVSLGMMPHIEQIPILMAAVVLLTLQAIVINRLAGIDFPLWSPKSE